jgi:hypothetical protein
LAIAMRQALDAACSAVLDRWLAQEVFEASLDGMMPFAAP